MEHRRHQPLFYSRLQLLYGYFWFDNVEVRRRGRCCFLYPFILFDGIPFFFILFFLEREPLQFFSLHLSHSHTRTHIHRQTEKHKTAAPKKNHFTTTQQTPYFRGVKNMRTHTQNTATMKIELKFLVKRKSTIVVLLQQ